MFIRLLSALILTSSLGWFGPTPTLKPAPAPPNVVFILADDFGYELIGANGGLSYKTPNLDKMAREGVRFDNCFSMPLCTPSRLQLMTGKHNFRNYERFGYLNTSQKTFANLFKDAGYTTAIAGKWQLAGGPDTVRHFGFDQFCLWQIDKSDFWDRYKDPILAENQLGQKRMGAYGPDEEVKFLTNFIEQNQQRKFFVYYPMTLTHDPFQPTPDIPEFKSFKINGTNDTTYFKNMVQYADRLVGQMINKLDSLKLLENTVIIFAGDNGTSVNITSQTRQGPVKGNKGYTTSAGNHVPLLVYWKGHTPSGVTRSELVDFTDVLPTMLDVAGLKKPDNFMVDGQSFWPAAMGKAGKKRDWVYSDYNPKRNDFPARKYAQTQKYKLYSDGQFFDYQNDPLENKPLSLVSLSENTRKVYDQLSKVMAHYQQQSDQIKK
ncbi:sulfatase-like hydrolase/transferase [Spirosoma endbachense]|uniref:Sulfatase-like hydrolase/transferase n=1 Tax=Spirosoma endbachense TaxID=2666025 RepID=A0A6P1VX05_9BACT|nr:sulfatase-like hydrolase/transferase [Spirosoma endbachense]QHV96612.1 sulfatase-like hydrolase/transferase [Spirosoma endbachense]